MILDVDVEEIFLEASELPLGRREWLPEDGWLFGRFDRHQTREYRRELYRRTNALRRARQPKYIIVALPRFLGMSETHRKQIECQMRK